MNVLASRSLRCNVTAGTASGRRRAACRGGAQPAGTFRIIQGSPKRYLAKADSGNDITRVFCGACGTPLYVQVSTRPDIVGIRVCTFDDASWFRPEANIFVESAQPWDHMDLAVPRLRPIRPERRIERGNLRFGSQYADQRHDQPHRQRHILRRTPV